MLRKSRRPRHGTVVAYLALFVALSGTSYAAVTLSKNSVRSKHIKNGQVKKADLRTDAVDTTKVKDGSLLSKDFKPGELVAGAPGPQGPKGDTGATGPEGPPNPNATNSDKVDGYHANQLARASTVTDATDVDNFNTCAYTSTISRNVTVPGPGVLLIWSGIAVERDSNSAAGERPLLEARLAVEGAPVSGSVMEASFHDSPSWFANSLSPSGSVAVTAGTKSVALQIRECSSGMLYITQRSLTTLFVPFGDSGTAGSLD